MLSTRSLPAAMLLLSHIDCIVPEDSVTQLPHGDAQCGLTGQTAWPSSAENSVQCGGSSELSIGTL